MSKFINRFIKNESGATAIEYALIVGIMATAVIAALGVFQEPFETSMGSVASEMAVDIGG